MTDPSRRTPILLVEDDDDHVEIISDVIREAGLKDELVRATSLKAAEEIARRIRPWVVLLDLGLPDSSGLATAKAFLNRLPELAVVVLTASTDHALGLAAVRCGAQDFLSKGRLSPEILRRALTYAFERRHLQLALEGKQRAVEAFASIASHDLRGPLGRIRTLGQFLKEDLDIPPGSEASEHLRLMDQNVHRMQRLIDDLLRFARVGKEGLKHEVFPLADAVDGAAALLAESVEASGAEIAKQELPNVHGDRGLVENLLQNLIGNAIKFVRNDVPRVSVQAEENEREHVIRIADNGIGIDPGCLSKIFEPLQRAVTPTEFEGSGLGLATCKSIVEAHGGRIACESSVGHGSTFLFTLPKASASATGERPDESI